LTDKLTGSPVSMSSSTQADLSLTLLLISIEMGKCSNALRSPHTWCSGKFTPVVTLAYSVNLRAFLKSMDSIALERWGVKTREPRW